MINKFYDLKSFWEIVQEKFQNKFEEMAFVFNKKFSSLQKILCFVLSEICISVSSKG